MNPEQLHCPACAAPISIPPDAGMITCGFCGASLRIQRSDGEVALFMTRQVTQAITDTGAQTKAAISDNTAVTREELRRMQLVNELSSLEVRLTSIEGEMRTVQRLPDSKLVRLQLQQLQVESTRLRSRIAAIRAVLYPQPKPVPTPPPPQSDLNLKGFFVAVFSVFLGIFLLTKLNALSANLSSARMTPAPIAAAAAHTATRQPSAMAVAVQGAANSPTVRPSGLPTLTLPHPAAARPTVTPAPPTATPTPRSTSAVPIVLPVRLRSAGGWEFTVERINLLANIDGGEQRHKPTNAAYVALIGTLRNLTFREACVHGGDFTLITNSAIASMDMSILDAAKDIYRVDYPGFFIGQCLGSNEAAPSILVFDSDPYAYSWLRMDDAEVDIGIPFANASMFKPVVPK